MLIAFEVLLLSRISLFQFLKVNIKQECIPVGCVPLERNHTDGVFLTKNQWIETPLDRDPLDRDPWTETSLDWDPWTETLLTETPPIGQSKKKSFNFYCKVMWNSTIGLK